MTKVQEIEKLLKSLSAEDLEKVSGVVSDMLETKVPFSDFMKVCVEERFSDGLVCPHCGNYYTNKEEIPVDCPVCEHRGDEYIYIDSVLKADVRTGEG